MDDITRRVDHVELTSHLVIQVSVIDFEEFDYIFAMDTSNLKNLRTLQQRGRAKDAKAKVMLFGEYSGGMKEEVIDPYYGMFYQTFTSRVTGLLGWTLATVNS